MQHKKMPLSIARQIHEAENLNQFQNIRNNQWHTPTIEFYNFFITFSLIWLE